MIWPLAPIDQLLNAWRIAAADRTFPVALPSPADHVLALPEARDTLARRVVAVAEREIGRGELSGKNNRGPDIIRYCGRDGVSWCAGGAGYCYEVAARELGVPLPFKRSLSAKTLGRNVAAAGRFLRVAEAQPGDLLVLHRDPREPWSGHVEIIERVAGDAVHTIAFNSGPTVRRRIHPLPIARLAFCASVRPRALPAPVA